MKKNAPQYDQIVNKQLANYQSKKYGSDHCYIIQLIRTNNLNQIKNPIIESSINRIDQDGNSYLHHAAALGHLEIVMFLAKHLQIAINSNNLENQNALDLALENKKTKVAKVLISNKININSTTIHKAIVTKDLVLISNIIELIIKDELNIDYKNQQGLTPLALGLTIKASYEIIHQLLKAKADPNLAVEFKDVIAQDPKIIKDLVRYGLIINNQLDFIKPELLKELIELQKQYIEQKKISLPQVSQDNAIRLTQNYLEPMINLTHSQGTLPIEIISNISEFLANKYLSASTIFSLSQQVKDNLTCLNQASQATSYQNKSQTQKILNNHKAKQLNSQKMTDILNRPQQLTYQQQILDQELLPNEIIR